MESGKQEQEHFGLCVRNDLQPATVEALVGLLYGHPDLQLLGFSSNQSLGTLMQHSVRTQVAVHHGRPCISSSLRSRPRRRLACIRRGDAEDAIVATTKQLGQVQNHRHGSASTDFDVRSITSY